MDNPRTLTVLVAEDNTLMRECIGTILRKNNIEAVAVENGQQALECLGRVAVDLILLDMLMPVLDGWHFLEALRKVVHGAATPVIVVTGTNLTREWAETHGCAGFIKKPFDEEGLLAEVRRCLGL
jgi:two-component system chemotaxis response regulator CheY